jgi:hypothetical protein
MLVELATSHIASPPAGVPAPGCLTAPTSASLDAEACLDQELVGAAARGDDDMVVDATDDVQGTTPADSRHKSFIERVMMAR